MPLLNAPPGSSPYALCHSMTTADPPASPSALTSLRHAPTPHAAPQRTAWLIPLRPLPLHDHRRPASLTPLRPGRHPPTPHATTPPRRLHAQFTCKSPRQRFWPPRLLLAAHHRANAPRPYALVLFLTAPYFRRARSSHPARFFLGFLPHAFSAFSSFCASVNAPVPLTPVVSTGNAISGIASSCGVAG